MHSVSYYQKFIIIDVSLVEIISSEILKGDMEKYVIDLLMWN